MFLTMIYVLIGIFLNVLLKMKNSFLSKEYWKIVWYFLHTSIKYGFVF